MHANRIFIEAEVWVAADTADISAGASGGGGQLLTRNLGFWHGAMMRNLVTRDDGGADGEGVGRYSR